MQREVSCLSLDLLAYQCGKFSDAVINMQNISLSHLGDLKKEGMPVYYKMTGFTTFSCYH